MTQIAIYIDNKLAERLEKAVQSSGKSKSKWVADAISNSLQDEWPDGFFDLAGSWQDDSSAEQIIKKIRSGMEMPEAREKLL